MHTSSSITARRAFLRASCTGGLALLGCASTREAKRDDDKVADKAGGKDDDEGDAEVTPAEDLMQEHGVLERILLVYGEGVSRIERSADLGETCAVVASAASLLKRFVEDYHERNEEQHVFPRLEAAKRELELVATLTVQHARGRAVTDDVIKLASAGPSASSTTELPKLLRAFERMYRPHAAREDTVLFPAFRAVVGRDAYRELGEQLEEEEHKKLGPAGFEGAVAEIAALEKRFGIGDLAAFTP